MPLNYFEETKIGNGKLPTEWQSQASLDELATFLQLNWEQRAVFYDDGQITSRQQFIGFTGQKGIRTQNYIGTIVFKGHQLNIFPKIFRTERDDNETDELDLGHLMKNLVRWLEYCTKIEYPYISITSELQNTTDLRDLFTTLYIRYVKAALEHGLYFRYEEQTEDTHVIKGKINIKDYFVKKIPNGQPDRFLCTFSTFEFDNLLNRIIKYTCKLIFNDVSKANQKIIRYILMKLNEVSDVRCVPQDCDTIRLSKLHRHYSIILSMSKIFLLNKSTTYNMDDTESFCFLFPTELLFEGFIGGYMQSILDGKAKVRLQASEVSVFSDIVYAGHSLGNALTMKHDILVEHKDKGLFILDTKYKMMDRFENSPDIRGIVNSEASSSDVYQVLTYARTRRLKDIYLLYPMFRYEEMETEFPIGINTTDIGGEPINVHLVRLPFVFESDVDKTKSQLRMVIDRIFG